MSNHKSSTAQLKTSPTDESAGVHVLSVRESMVSIDTGGKAIKKNEVGFICVGQERLMAEVLRVHGYTADMQVFEDTRGVRVGEHDLLGLGAGHNARFLGPSVVWENRGPTLLHELLADRTSRPVAFMSSNLMHSPTARSRETLRASCWTRAR